MVDIPEKLFKKAVACGLICTPSASGEHCISPQTEGADWQLTYQKGRWVLTVNGTPQMYFHYDDVLRFLERVAQSPSIGVRPSSSPAQPG